MSFILDALRKSEHARQHIGGATLAELPLGRRPRSQPWWVIALAILLAVNLIVLTLVLLRKDREVVVAPPIAAPPIQLAATSPPAALAEEAAAPNVEYEIIPREESPLADDASDGPRLVKAIDPSPQTAATDDASELRIDMHVYAQNPQDRFVFINMRKYTEGQTLADGSRVASITANGVTLLRNGHELHLPRP